MLTPAGDVLGTIVLVNCSARVAPFDINPLKGKAASSREFMGVPKQYCRGNNLRENSQFSHPLKTP